VNAVIYPGRCNRSTLNAHTPNIQSINRDHEFFLADSGVKLEFELGLDSGEEVLGKGTIS
jgi:hypothetical protein